MEPCILERFSQLDTGEKRGGGQGEGGTERVSPETGFPERTPHEPT